MANAVDSGVQIDQKSISIVSGLSLLYLILSCLLLGFKSDQLVLIGIFNVLFYASVITRKFILGFSIFIVYWIIFDYMKAFPNYNYNEVAIDGLYNAEKSLFGIHYNNTILTPNEYLLLKSNTYTDIFAGVFYLCWIPVPLGFAAYLFFRNKQQFLYFSLTFVVVNLLGFVIYYTYPAAPPWYVQVHGFNFHPLTPGNTAGLARFDKFFNVTVFKSIYAKGSNVFAAMPSLHSSYPVIVLYYGIKNRLGAINIFFATVTVGIWFTAVYASHHYVLDVLAGITCASLGILLFNLILSHSAWLKRSLLNYEKLIQ
ncbi:phosphatase PAP2 family protein [Mucilaginibacter psychrotolerans]|uniref:Inositol phosphorylceramide synthase n=1 Tax=Mucilaginibacter psychrotolerans TaxID=1524096 RepID=A0A4Y8SKK1_9SPHI|nr:phosphatase PAP2 family protein [Mucilaginibacter psychrotolerans]TFF39180.1 inositol phosphorylceramide synthase [Mucilaginibacter psychrotolerans]